MSCQENEAIWEAVECKLDEELPVNENYDFDILSWDLEDAFMYLETGKLPRRGENGTL